MIRLQARTLGIVLDSTLTSIRPYSEEYFSTFSLRALEALRKYGLVADSFALDRGEKFLTYDFTFSLFNGGFVFRHSSDRINLSFPTIQNDAGIETAIDTTQAVYGLFDKDAFSEHGISAFAHMAFADNPETLPQRFSNPEHHIDFAGVVAYVRVADWNEPIRVLIDKSLYLANGLFINWSSKYPGVLDDKVLRRTRTAFERVLTQLDLCYAEEPMDKK